MNKKIVFFDIDGTLLDQEIGIPSSTIEGIQQLKDNGHIPVICTGRTKAMITKDILDIGFDGIIAGAGTYVEYKDKIIHNKVSDGTFAKKIIPLLQENGVNFIVEGPEYIYFERNYKEKNYGIAQFIDNVVGKSKIKIIDYNDMKLNKFSCNFPNEKCVKKLTPKLKEMFYLVPHEGTNFIELLPPGYNKSKGIETLINYLNIDRKDTYAFGDSTNDIEMLDYVQYGIAMGNSYPKVLENAKYTTKSIEEDGIYYGLKQFELI